MEKKTYKSKWKCKKVFCLALVLVVCFKGKNDKNLQYYVKCVIIHSKDAYIGPKKIFLGGSKKWQRKDLTQLLWEHGNWSGG